MSQHKPLSHCRFIGRGGRRFPSALEMNPVASIPLVIGMFAAGIGYFKLWYQEPEWTGAFYVLGSFCFAIAFFCYWGDPDNRFAWIERWLNALYTQPHRWLLFVSLVLSSALGLGGGFGIGCNYERLVSQPVLLGFCWLVSLVGASGFVLAMGVEVARRLRADWFRKNSPRELAQEDYRIPMQQMIARNRTRLNRIFFVTESDRNPPT